jgi:hypothetical protein
MRDLIPEEAVQAAFDWLRENSQVVGGARANLIRAEFRAKRVHARLMRHATGAMELRKAQATDSEEYAEAMEQLARAEEIWETLKDKRSKAEAILEAWRTQEASQRGLRQVR